MKLKKIVAAAAAAVMALAMLTACSGGGGGGGVTVKKIAYKDSRMAQMETQVASTKQFIFGNGAERVRYYENCENGSQK